MGSGSPRFSPPRRAFDLWTASALKGGALLSRATARTIPAGIENEQKIRLKGKGYPGSNGGPNGDILLAIKIAPHPDYRRNGNDLELTMPLTLAEALQGTELDIPTPYSTITLKIPAGTPSGKRFRVKQHGVTHKTGKGNLFVITQIHLPDETPAELIEQVHALQQPNPRNQINW